jgi:hypothetical protein
LSKFAKSFPVTMPEYGPTLQAVKDFIESGLVEGDIEIIVQGEIPGLSRVRSRGTTTAKKKRKAVEPQSTEPVS